MPTLTGQIKITSDWIYQDPDVRGFDDGAKPPEHNRRYESKHTWEISGDDDGQVNRMFRERRQVTSTTTTDDLDLAGGLTDVWGNTLTFIAIKELIIFNRANASGEILADYLLVGGAGAGGNAWGALFGGDQDATQRVFPQGDYVVTAPRDGIPVTAGTGDILRVAHDGITAEIEYDIIIKGIVAGP